MKPKTRSQHQMATRDLYREGGNLPSDFRARHKLGPFFFQQGSSENEIPFRELADCYAIERDGERPL